MLQKTLSLVGTQISQYAGNEKKVPNMRNGRSFPTSVALCKCPLEMLTQWLQIPRNEETSTPIRMQNFHKVTDTSRQAFELAFAKLSAKDIINKLQACPDLSQPSNAEIVQRLDNGQDIEVGDLRPLATAIGMNLQIHDLHHQAFLEIQVSAGLPTYKMIYFLHWEPIVTLPPLGLLLASRESLAALGWRMKYNPIAALRIKLASTIRQVRKQRRQIEQLETDNRALASRFTALEQQVANAVSKSKPNRKIVPSAYSFYIDSIRQELTGSASAQAREVEDRWHALSPEEKQVFKEKHEEAKRELQP